MILTSDEELSNKVELLCERIFIKTTKTRDRLPDIALKASLCLDKLVNLIKSIHTKAAIIIGKIGQIITVSTI